MKNYYDWLADTATCAACGWSGPGREASLAEMYESGAEYCCPKCSHDLGFVPFPSTTEALRDPRAKEIDRTFATLIEDGQPGHRRNGWQSS